VVQRVHLLRRLPGPPAVPAEGQDVRGGQGRQAGGGRDRSGRFRSCSLCRRCWFSASWRWRCHGGSLHFARKFWENGVF
jgi:hypothetical protein